MDDFIQEKVTQKENELNATYDEKMRNYEERYVLRVMLYSSTLMRHDSEQDLQRQLALTKNQLRDLRLSHESNQAKLFDHTQRQGAHFDKWANTTLLTTIKIKKSFLSWLSST